MATPTTADYIIVGGGLTGCVIASRLSQSSQKPKVVLLEAGSDPSGNDAAKTFLTGLGLLGGEFDYSYQSDPVATTANRVHSLNAGKALGGGSLLNFGGWLQADSADYDEWAKLVEDKRWSYEGLKPWFRKTEKFYGLEADTDEHGSNGPMYVTSVSAAESGARTYPLREPVKQGWSELGVPLNLDKKHGSITGLTEMWENSRDGMRQPSNIVYPLNGVEVFTNTAVHKVTFTDGTADGVILSDGRRLTARKEVILCAGAYGTPQVLMRSGVGPSSDLKAHGIPIVHEAPGVGENLHDHFAIYLAFRLRDPSLGYAMGHPSWGGNMALFKGLPWDWIVNAPLPAEVTEKHGIEAKDRGRSLYEVITLYLAPGLPGIAVDGNHIATSTMLLRPTSRGKVSLQSDDAKAPPRIQPNYLDTSFDRDTLIHATRQTLKLMLSTSSMSGIVEGETPPSGEGLDGVQPLTADATDEQIEERIRRTGMQHHHSGGTAAMGKVVDVEGRVMGIKNLRCADASIVPIPLGGHPQATLYPMAEQLASLIIGDM